MRISDNVVFLDVGGKITISKTFQVWHFGDTTDLLAPR